MNYSTVIPESKLKPVVECFWSVTGTDTEQQKIIPDGFPEMIFHFGDPYEIFDQDTKASTQGNILMSGQISRPIVLRATGRSDVFGIKFKPAGIWKLLQVNMSTLKDQVISYTSDVSIQTLYDELKTASAEARIRCVEKFIFSKLNENGFENEIDSVLETIENKKGDVSIEGLCSDHSITQRTLQRIFQQRVGITAKQYARITRFKTVYALLQKPSLTKTDSIYLSGYFDQPHFNKEFREFTDENPEKWFGANNSFSNLFMNR
jgi:AraC-like DNA-binding protein